MIGKAKHQYYQRFTMSFQGNYNKNSKGVWYFEYDYLILPSQIFINTQSRGFN
jgi:hypothetical protein